MLAIRHRGGVLPDAGREDRLRDSAAAPAAGFSAAIRGLRPGYHRDRGVYLAREARARAADLAAQALLTGIEIGPARIFAELAAVHGVLNAAMN